MGLHPGGENLYTKNYKTLIKEMKAVTNKKLDSYLTLHAKSNSKWIKCLNVSLETINLEENIVKHSLKLILAMIFLAMTP